MTTGASDRRRSWRRLEGHGIVSARIRPGYDVAIIDVSAGGALVEGDYRLLPGTAVELHLRSDGQRAECIKGRVGRCAVARLQPDSIRYRGAIVFDQRLHWFFDRNPAGMTFPLREIQDSAHVQMLPEASPDDRPRH